LHPLHVPGKDYGLNLPTPNSLMFVHRIDLNYKFIFKLQSAFEKHIKVESFVAECMNRFANSSNAVGLSENLLFKIQVVHDMYIFLNIQIYRN